MNRHYTTDEYRQIVEMVRGYWNDVAFTTDIIVGFPGESDEDFERTVEFVKEIGFSRIHVFRFSPKKGTNAYNMPYQVNSAEKEKRSEILKSVARKLSFGFHKKFEGKIVDVLIEENSSLEGYFEGYSGNYIRTLVPKTESIRVGEIYKVKVKEAFEQYVIGDIIF